MKNIIYLTRTLSAGKNPAASKSFDKMASYFTGARALFLCLKTLVTSAITAQSIITKMNKSEHFKFTEEIAYEQRKGIECK